MPLIRAHAQLARPKQRKAGSTVIVVPIKLMVRGSYHLRVKGEVLIKDYSVCHVWERPE